MADAECYIFDPDSMVHTAKTLQKLALQLAGCVSFYRLQSLANNNAAVRVVAEETVVQLSSLVLSGPDALDDIAKQLNWRSTLLEDDQRLPDGLPKLEEIDGNGKTLTFSTLFERVLEQQESIPDQGIDGKQQEEFVQTLLKILESIRFNDSSEMPALEPGPDDGNEADEELADEFEDL